MKGHRAATDYKIVVLENFFYSAELDGNPSTSFFDGIKRPGAHAAARCSDDGMVGLDTRRLGRTRRADGPGGEGLGRVGRVAGG